MGVATGEMLTAVIVAFDLKDREGNENFLILSSNLLIFLN